jgi:hypothetical protein
VPKTSGTKRTELWKRVRTHRDKWRKSGQSRWEYAEKAGLAPSTFSRWLRKLDEESSDPSHPTTVPKAAVSGRREAPRVTRPEPGLLAVHVVPSFVIDGHERRGRTNGTESGTEVSPRERPVEIELPGGVRIRYPAGASPTDLVALVNLLEGRC